MDDDYQPWTYRYEYAITTLVGTFRFAVYAGSDAACDEIGFGFCAYLANRHSDAIMEHDGRADRD